MATLYPRDMALIMKACFYPVVLLPQEPVLSITLKMRVTCVPWVSPDFNLSVQMPLLAAFLPWVSLSQDEHNLGSRKAPALSSTPRKDVGKTLQELSIRLYFHALQAWKHGI